MYNKNTQPTLIKIILTALITISPMTFATEQTERLIQQEQKRQQQQREKLIPQKPHTKPTEQKLAPAPKIDDTRCLDIHTITLKGATLLTKKQQNTFTTPYLNQCLTLNQINELAHTIKTHYYNKGYVLTQTVFPEQDLNTGTLTIQILESTIESINITQGLNNTELTLAMPTTQGKHLNLRDLEQGLDQLNRLSSNNATLDLQAGSQIGTTKINLKNEKQRPYHLNLALDNSGQRETGERQRNVTLTYDSPLGLGDYVALSTKYDDSSNARKKSESVALYYEVPLGYWTFALDTTYFGYLSDIDLVNESLESRGKSRSQALSALRVLHRNATHTTKAGLKIQRKDTVNYLDNINQDSSRTLTLLAANLIHDQHFQNGRLYSELIYTKGINWLDATQDPEHPADDTPRAQFEKWNLRSDYIKQFPWLTRTWTWLTNIEAQYSNDWLYGSEQFSAGGQYTIRGYKDDSLSGDKGLFASTALRVNLIDNLPAIKTVNIEGGLDYALVNTEHFGEEGEGFEGHDKIRGWRLGLNTTGSLNLSLTYARPIKALDYLKHNKDEWYFSLGVNL